LLAATSGVIGVEVRFAQAVIPAGITPGTSDAFQLGGGQFASHLSRGDAAFALHSSLSLIFFWFDATRTRDPRETENAPSSQDGNPSILAIVLCKGRGAQVLYKRSRGVESSVLEILVIVAYSERALSMGVALRSTGPASVSDFRSDVPQ
jgi:hypothetical protein